MAIAKPVVYPFDYSVRRGEDHDVEFVAEREVIHFREEVIPDGVLAGQVGHLQVPSQQEMVFSMPPMQALEVWRQLGDALGIRLPDGVVLPAHLR